MSGTGKPGVVEKFKCTLIERGFASTRITFVDASGKEELTRTFPKAQEKKFAYIKVGFWYVDSLTGAPDEYPGGDVAKPSKST